MSCHEFEDLVGSDSEILDSFLRVNVPEPDVATAIALVARYAAGLESQFSLRIDDAAQEQAVILTDNYILNERLPGKAVKILHRICEDVDYERRQLGLNRHRVTADDVIDVVSQITGIPTGTLRGIAEAVDFEQSLKQEIVGQDHAVKEVTRELGLIKAGLTDANKPASVMLFVGQTGTGKTEMAKALARFYSSSKRLRTYTLGNFVEPHSVAGIIGVPPGYVGHDQGGRLISDLNSDPYCVFLLDEADKAHPDVLQPFLNLFDEGWIRDQRGAQGYADRAIFILTTNVGQRMIADMAKKGKSPEEIATRMKEALSQIRHGKSNRPVFAPEFLARIKRVIVFKPLDLEAMEGICRKLVRESQRMWEQKRQRSLLVPEMLIQHIATEAHRRNEKSEGREGGRIVHKLLADLVDSNIQVAISQRPDEYRTCKAVEVTYCVPERDADSADQSGETVAPTVEVRFQAIAATKSLSERGKVEQKDNSV